MGPGSATQKVDLHIKLCPPWSHNLMKSPALIFIINDGFSDEMSALSLALWKYFILSQSDHRNHRPLWEPSSFLLTGLDTIFL